MSRVNKDQEFTFSSSLTVGNQSWYVQEAFLSNV